MSSEPEASPPAKVSLGWSFWVMIVVVIIATRLGGLVGGALAYGVWWLGSIVLEKLRAQKS
jgi:hypothetical protein